jgi:hypothetical protein
LRGVDAGIGAMTAPSPSALTAALLRAVTSVLNGRDARDVGFGKLGAIIAEHRALPPRSWAVLGEVSVGKSSLLNTLLGRDVLPEGNQSTSTVPIQVVAPDPRSPDGTLVLEPRSADDLIALLRWLIGDRRLAATPTDDLIDAARAWLTDEAAAAPERARLVEQVLGRLGDSRADIGAPVRSRLGALDDLLPLDPMRWRRARLSLDSPWAGLGIEWLDLPGLGHPNPLHRWMTEQAIVSSEQTFCLVEPRGATETTLGLLAGLDSSQRERVTLVFSRIDETLAHGEDWRAACAVVLEQLGWQGRWAAVSAACARAARAALLMEPGQRALRSLERVAMQHTPLSPLENLDLSGVPAFQERLRTEAAALAWAPLRRLVADLRAALVEADQQLDAQWDGQRQSALDRLSAAVAEQRDLLSAESRSLAAQLRIDTRRAIVAERAAFAALDDGINAAEARQVTWLRALSWDMRQKVAVAKVLSGLCKGFAGWFRVMLNVGMAPYGATSARCEAHARDLVNLRRLGALLDPLDKLHGTSFFASRAARLRKLAPFARWATALGFVGPLRAEALGYVARLGLERADAERDWLSAQQRASGLGRWRTPLRASLARHRRERQVALARLYDEGAIRGLAGFAASAERTLTRVASDGTAGVEALAEDPDHGPRQALAGLRAQLDLVEALMGEVR